MRSSRPRWPRLQTSQAAAAAQLILIILVGASSSSETGCDVTISSRDLHNKTGKFSSPNYPEDYGDNLHCIYKFIGRPHEKVKIKFTFFEVKGIRPRCLHDYVDVYTIVKDPDQDILDLALHGRYCGEDMDRLPHAWVSMFNTIIIGFYTDREVTQKGFEGEYEFIDASPYNVGLQTDTMCDYLISSTTNLPSGTVLSPTYPGQYPDGLSCTYKLWASPGQRIKVTFNDLDIHSGGDYCPFDSLTVYDGKDNKAPVIGNYCGRHKHQSIFSTHNALFMEFITRSGRPEPTKAPYVTYSEILQDMKVKRQGFNMTYTFSSDLVDLSFIKSGKHVRGTECDQLVQSEGHSNGSITSPNYPDLYPANVVCQYYLDGMVDLYNLENVKLQIIDLDVPTKDRSCTGGYIDFYKRGQDIRKVAPDQRVCGSHPPPSIETDNPRLLLTLNTTGGSEGRGFKALYSFKTFYAVPGTPVAPAVCHFIYRSSSSRKKGVFNSPRYPSYYMPNTTCIYEFIGLPKERVRITFHKFETETDASKKECTRDYVEIFSVSNRPYPYNKTKILRHCGALVPGPITSEIGDHKLQLVFYSDLYGAMSGFVADYEFIEQHPYTRGCIQNITRGGGGEIKIPETGNKYRKNLTCEWNIRASRSMGLIMIYLVSFQVEGSLYDDSSHGCPKAALRIYTTKSTLPTIELCGSTLPNGTRQYISQGPVMRIKFTTARHALGTDGFTIAWTEIIPKVQCTDFKCKESGFCISKGLVCNKVHNCGGNDKSDEAESLCVQKAESHVMKITLGIIISLVLTIIILVCIIHRRRKVHKKKNRKQVEVKYVTPGISGMRAGDRLLLHERTEKVSIV